jgi:hypothetical protein
MAIPAHVFRKYDIRGLVETELTPAIVPGRDRRCSS